MQMYLSREQTSNYQVKRLEKFFNGLQVRHDRYVFGCFKLAWQTVQWKRERKVGRMVRAWTKRMKEVVGRWRKWKDWKNGRNQQITETQLLKFALIGERYILRTAFNQVY